MTERLDPNKLVEMMLSKMKEELSIFPPPLRSQFLIAIMRSSVYTLTELIGPETMKEGVQCLMNDLDAMIADENNATTH